MKSFLASLPPPGNVVLDLDGVVFLGSTAIPGAGDALAVIAASGVRTLFATNNATKTTSQIAARLADGAGYETDPASIVTSAVAAAGCLSSTDDPVFAVGEGGLAATLTAAGHAVTDDPGVARSVVVGLDREISYAKLEGASTAVRRGARYIATNTDATFPVPGGSVPGAGALIAAVSTAAGRNPEVAGKPHPPMIEQIRRHLAPGSTWMIGDRPETDLALAKAAGWTAVLTLSGITADVTTVPAELTPDATIESIRDLVEVFA